MSLPKSKVLRVNRGVGFVAQAKTGCPKQSVTVNVINDKATTRDVDEDVEKVEEKVENVNATAAVNPYANIEDGPLCGTARSAGVDANADVNVEYRDVEFKNMLVNKDHQIKALQMMLELIENNPLVINKYIIADFNTLIELIHLLTNADEITVSELDPDVGCTCKAGIYHYIDKIYVKKNGDTRILKYEYPDVVQLLDLHRISLKTFYITEQ